jgi:type IV secretion system protein VirD4
MDIKGENFHVTHEQRIAAGGEVYVLDPFRVTGFTHGLHAYANPLDTIDTHGSRKDRALDDCKTLAEMLVEEDGKENRHFSDEGRSLLACFMLYVCDEFNNRREQRTLMKVRELLTLPAEEFTALLKRMADSDNELVRRGVARLQQKEERERTGVISTAQRGIDFLDSIPMANVLVPPLGSDLEAEKPEERPRQVDLSLIKGDVPMTIYLVIPPEALKTHAAWIRMMIACINNMITRIPGRPRHRILMLLDEFAQLGHIRPVVEGISLVGGYGVLFWIIIQDLAQLKGLYKDNWETIFANCDVKQCFGTNDWTTADLLSKMTGETTLFTEGGSSGKGRSYGKSSGHSINYGESISEKGRRLLMADEVMRLPPSRQLLFVKGSAPLLVDKINYLTDPEFRGPKGERLFKPNPMYN